MAAPASWLQGRTSRPRRLLPACAVLLLGLGCGRAARRPPTPPPTPSARPAPGYERRIEALAGANASALKGKRIVLDPGHGGIFRGALGVNGLTEAEVNLGVALHLWGLLQAAGAQGRLTRTDDRDFLSAADSSLRADLAERSRIAAEADPDVFLSIHHNADARGLHDVNQTQTYYRLGDEGPSLELAQALHRHLIRNLGISEHRLLPGNFFVLRNSRSPAVLTEASYITNPDVEERLALAAKQRLEAEALFLGLVDYFSTPAPMVTEFWVSLPGAGRTPLAPTVSLETGVPELHARIRGLFDLATLLLDSSAVPFERRGEWIQALAASPLRGGPHRAELSVALAAGRSARSVTLEFQTVKPAAKLEALPHPPSASPRGGMLALELRVRDSDGLPTSDSLRVRVRARGATPTDTVVVAKEGESWAYFRTSGTRSEGARSKVAPASQTAVELTAALLDTVTGARRRRVDEARTRFPLQPRPAYWVDFLRDVRDDLPLTNARLAAPPQASAGRRGLSPHGFYWEVLDDSGHAEGPVVLGFRPVGDDGSVPRRWSARCGGSLLGRRIVLDAEGGGEDAAGVGKSGTRAASLNLEVARVLAAYLEAAGARVLLTRDGDYALSEVERVQQGERFGPERFLKIGHGAERPRIGHYFSSAAGRAWAQRCARWLERTEVGPAPSVVEDAQYVIQQTSCPALYVSALRVDDPGQEQRLLEPGLLRREAYALYLGLAEELGAAVASWQPDSVTVADSAGTAFPYALVEAGGMIHQADSRGVARWMRTEPGALEVEVQNAEGSRSARLLLESPGGARILLPPPRP